MADDIRYSPQVASYKLKMDVFEFLDRALKGEVAMVLPTMGGVSRADPSMIQGYLNCLSEGIPPSMRLEVEEDELERFALTLTPDKWPNSVPFMDPNHPCFARELEAAISAWMALFAAGDRSNRSPTDQIRDWLRQNRTSLSDKAITRIATVTNYKKTGGPKPI